MHSPFIFLLTQKLFAVNVDNFFFVLSGQGPKVRRPMTRKALCEATFGMGCFWKPSEELLEVDGVVDTVVGYTGVVSNAVVVEPPNYDTVCFSRDWVEGVRVIYDDEQITYLELLKAFFEKQQPDWAGRSRQYASFIFYHNSQQESLAQQWQQENLALVRKDGVAARFTQIEPLSPFFRAENYHQRYWQKMRPRIGVCLTLMAIGSGALDTITPVD